MTESAEELAFVARRLAPAHNTAVVVVLVGRLAATVLGLAALEKALIVVLAIQHRNGQRGVDHNAFSE